MENKCIVCGSSIITQECLNEEFSPIWPGHKATIKSYRCFNHELDFVVEDSLYLKITNL